jgi:hypothetical protein
VAGRAGIVADGREKRFSEVRALRGVDLELRAGAALGMVSFARIPRLLRLAVPLAIGRSLHAASA